MLEIRADGSPGVSDSIEIEPDCRYNSANGLSILPNVAPYGVEGTMSPVNVIPEDVTGRFASKMSCAVAWVVTPPCTKGKSSVPSKVVATGNPEIGKLGISCYINFASVFLF